MSENQVSNEQMKETRFAWGVGLATVSNSGTTLDVWYPQPQLGEQPEATDSELVQMLGQVEGKDPARGVYRTVVRTQIDLDVSPQSTADAYLRLHLLSHRLVKPNTINLDGIFARLPNVVWTNEGPCAAEDFEATRLRMRIHYGRPIHLISVDKFPPMVNYVVPSGVRIADGAKVRLGAYLAEGTTVMHAGFVNFNAGSLGACMIEGRVSQGVVLEDGSDIGGGASTMGTLSGGGTTRVCLGKRCLIGANAGLGIPLGNDCIVEAGLYITAGTKVTVLPNAGVSPSAAGYFTEPQVVRAADLAGVSDVIFRRNSQSGRVEALPRQGKEIKLNPALHNHN